MAALTAVVPVCDNGRGKEPLTHSLSDALKASDDLPPPARELPPLQPDWKHRGCCSSPGACLWRIVSVVLHPLVLCLFIITLLLDLVYRWISPCWRGNWSACLRRDWLPDLIGSITVGLMGFFSTFAIGAVAHYSLALRLAHHFGFMLTVRLLAFTPWPTGRTRKIFVLARMNRVRDVARLTGMKIGNRESDSRDAAVDMWRAVEMRQRSEQRRFDLVREYIRRGADINFPNEDGSTLLHHFAAYVEADYIKWLLENNANPNVQDVRGNTPLHVACMSAYDGGEVIKSLLKDPTIDPCVYNCDGRSPLMLRLHKKKPVDALIPAISWEAIEDAIVLQSATSCLSELVKLARAGPPALRLPDHLFCATSREVTVDELDRRRYRLWSSVLKPATLEVCTSKELDQKEKAFLQYVWEATEGPKQLREDARSTYREEIQEVFEDVMDSFATEILQSQPDVKAHKKHSLDEVEEIRTISEADMNHGSFQSLPGWAITRDLLRATKELERLRVLRFAEELCDLLRCGRISCEQSHTELNMLNKSRYDVFTTRRKIHKKKRLKKVTPGSSKSSRSSKVHDLEQGHAPISPKSHHSDDSVRSIPSRNSLNSCSSSLSRASSTSTLGDPTKASKNRKVPDATIDFWMGLVTVWLLALHLYLRPSLVRRIGQIAHPSEFKIAPAKDFEYVMKKARARIANLSLKKWRDRVLAPLYVTDILTCSFEVQSPARAHAIEEALAGMFAVVYSENCFDFDTEEVKHCHHEFVHLLESDFAGLGHVGLLMQTKVFLVSESKLEHKLTVVRDISDAVAVDIFSTDSLKS